MTWGANIDEKVDGLFASIDRTRRPDRKRSGEDLRVVPRPPRPAQPGKIDISNAPSSMEDLAKRWRGQ